MICEFFVVAFLTLCLEVFLLGPFGFLLSPKANIDTPSVTALPLLIVLFYLFQLSMIATVALVMQVSLGSHKLENLLQCFLRNVVVYGAGNGIVASKSQSYQTDSFSHSFTLQQFPAAHTDRFRETSILYSEKIILFDLFHIIRPISFIIKS